MSYADEMKLGADEAQAEMGEVFMYEGLPYKGLFSDEDPSVTMLATGKNTMRALICDAQAAQFAAAPVAGKRLTYSGDGKSYMIRQVHPVVGGTLRLHLYLP